MINKDDQALNRWNPEGKTPIMLAIEHERHLALTKLLELGADISLKESKSGNNVMHISAWKGNLPAAWQLMKLQPELAIS